MSDLKEYSQRTFKEIKDLTEYDIEFWNAIELQKVLEYDEWRNFLLVIDYFCE